MALETAPVRGVKVHYGTRKTTGVYGRQGVGNGPIKTAEWVVDLGEAISGAPTTSNEVISPSTSELELVLPAYAVVVSCRAEVTTALATTGGSAASSASLQVGLQQSDGTEIDNDGLIDATDGDLTIASNDIAEPKGTVLVGSNAALVPNVDIGANAGELVAKLVIDDVTDMTAVSGVVRILVEYMVSKDGN